MVRGIQYCYAVAMAALCLSASASQAADSTYGFGVEGFTDTYKEDSIGENSTTTGGSVTGYYSHPIGHFFYAIDARGSYGTENYSATDNATNFPLPAGSVNSVPQWEFELRMRLGRTYQVWDGNLSPYLGLGVRYTRDEGKDYFTNAQVGSFEDFDTDTWQYYVPIGVSYSHDFGNGWSITPLAEADIMFYGDVNQHVTNDVFVGAFNIPADNNQTFGLGGRGELMLGKDMGGYDVEIGPFIRYWSVQKSDSSLYKDSAGNPLYIAQPSNTSMEIGGALKLLW